MRRVDLAGEWTVRRSGTKKTIPAVVPGCVHADLLAAGEIADPLFRRNVESVGWVAETEWIFEKVFTAEDFSAFEWVVLRLDGVDGRAVVRLNDSELGRIANAFEFAEFDVKALLKTGKNRLAVTFLPTVLDERKKALRTQASALGLAGLPPAPTAGICRGVSLLAFSGVRVRDVLIRQNFAVSGGVGLSVAVTAERHDPAEHLEVLVRVCYKGNILHEARDILGAETTTLTLTIKNPQLWWPVGVGDQPLYEVTVDVLAGRSCLEHVSRRIGLRQFAVERTDVDGEAVYRFFVNRHPLFFKGASWLPADLYPARMTRVEYARLVKVAAVANMNVLRVWGGGAYENDAFYDLCDEYGLCVWQDLMRCDAQSEAPSAERLAAVTREIDLNVRRLRHHPCVVTWCVGDRDAAQSPDAAYVSAAVEQASATDPDRDCLPPMPHAPFSLGGRACAAPVPLPAFPEPRTVAQYLGDDERNASHPVSMFHTTPADGVQRMYHAFLERFLLPSSFENTVWLSQIQQGVVLRRCYERARIADKPAPGFVFWHLNDPWPACSPASVSYGGRWKALHYQARRFFAPVWLCGDYRAETATVELFAFNDGIKPFKGEVQWRLTEMEGTVVSEGAKKVSLVPAVRERAAVVKVAEPLKKFGAGNLLLWLYLMDEQGNQVASNGTLFCAPRELTLLQPRMRAEIRSWDDNSFAVTLTSHRPAMWVWLTLDGMEARFDDNFFCLEPEKPMRVRVTPAERIKLDQFRQLIRIGSLRDTWQEKRGLMQMMAASKKPGSAAT